MADTEKSRSVNRSPSESSNGSDTSSDSELSSQSGSKKQEDEKAELNSEQTNDKNENKITEEVLDSPPEKLKVAEVVQSSKESTDHNENNQSKTKEHEETSVSEPNVKTESPIQESMSPTRLVSDAVPMMKTQRDNDLNVITERMDRVPNPNNKSSYSPQPIKLQNYPNVQSSNGRNAYNTYQPSSSLTNKPRPEATSVWASGARNAPAPQPLDIPPLAYTASPQSPLATSPWRSSDGGEQGAGRRKSSSGSATYIGSRVIAAETGPSLTVMLRRPTSEKPWGFTFHGGAELGCPPFVNKVSNHGVAMSFGLQVGDVLVSISNALTVGKTQDQLKAEILRSGNELDLIIIRRGVDLEKIAELVPHAIPTSPRSPTSASPLSSREHSTVCVFDDLNQRSLPSSQMAQRFRQVKTRSMQLLEDQLNSGQATSVLSNKQNLQGARRLPAQGTSSSFTHAYGEPSGRVVSVPGAPGGTPREVVWPERVDYQVQVPLHRPPGQPTLSQHGEPSSYGGNIQQAYQPTTVWHSQSNFSPNPNPTFDNQYTERFTQYPTSNVNQAYPAGKSYTTSTTVTIPIRGRQPYGNYMPR